MLMMSVGIISFCIIGCDQDTRYKVLTFFFEGVPEPGTKRSGWGSDANSVYRNCILAMMKEER